MTRSSSRFTAFAAFLSFAAVSRGGRAIGADQKIDLSGRWALNEALSDDPAAKMREAASARGSSGSGADSSGSGGGGYGGGFGGGSRGGMGGGGFGGRGHGGSRGGGGKGGETGAPPSDVLQTLHHLVITQKDPELRIVNPDGEAKERVLFTDGRKVEEERLDGTLKIKTKKKSDSIVVTSDYASGREVTETWELLTPARRLLVLTKVDGRRGAFTFKRVYDPELESAAPATEAPATSVPPPSSSPPSGVKGGS